MTIKGLSASVVAVLMLAGCSATGEDPRISLCSSIAADLSGTDKAAWQHTGTTINRPEDAEITVSGTGRTASCVYDYDAVEESALDHADELNAYATLPSKVTIEGRVLQGAPLRAAVTSAQKRVAENVKREAEEVVKKAEEGMQRAADEVRKTLDQ